MAKTIEFRKEVVLDATPDQVWQAIATSEGLATWFQPVEIGPDSDMVAVWEPGKRLVTQVPVYAGGTEFLVEEHEDRATLQFMLRGRDDHGYTAMGWEMYLHTLGQYFEHFADRPVVYVEAEGPPSSARPAAWPRLVDALGLAQPVRPGADVHVALPGAPPIDGVVDYATAHFIGLRTPDALIRFHGRAPVDLPIAVSHHAYGRGFDAQAATRAWESWLATALA